MYRQSNIQTTCELCGNYARDYRDAVLFCWWLDLLEWDRQDKTLINYINEVGSIDFIEEARADMIESVNHLVAQKPQW